MILYRIVLTDLPTLDDFTSDEALGIPAVDDDPEHGVGQMGSYELWQTRTRNLIGAFATEAEALAVVRRAVETHGPAFIDTVLLGREDDKGRSRTIAQGRDLLMLAQRGDDENTRLGGKPTSESGPSRPRP